MCTLVDRQNIYLDGYFGKLYIPEFWLTNKLIISLIIYTLNDYVAKKIK